MKRWICNDNGHSLFLNSVGYNDDTIIRGKLLIGRIDSILGIGFGLPDLFPISGVAGVPGATGDYSK